MDEAKYHVVLNETQRAFLESALIEQVNLSDDADLLLLGMIIDLPANASASPDTIHDFTL